MCVCVYCVCQNKHDPNESWYAWWRAQMEFRNGAAAFNKVVIFIRQWRFMLLGLCFAEAAHWYGTHTEERPSLQGLQRPPLCCALLCLVCREWHHILASPSMIQGKLTVPTWEGAWEMVQQSPLLAPVIFVILLIVSMALSTHNRDHHPKFYNPKDTRVRRPPKRKPTHTLTHNSLSLSLSVWRTRSMV